MTPTNLRPTDAELAELEAAASSPLDLQQALAERDARLATHRQATSDLHNAEAEVTTADAMFRVLTQSKTIVARIRRKLGSAKAAEQELTDARARAAVTRRVVDSAEGDRDRAQAAVVLAAHSAYESLILDKRTGFDAIACSQWRSDAEDEEPYCHCPDVPGNTLRAEFGDDFVPHDSSNYQGRPWCAACQSWECIDGPHPAVTLEQFVARFALAQE